MRRLFAAVSVVALAVAMGAPSLAQDGADGKIAAQIEEMQKEQAEMLRKLKSLEEQLAKLKEQQARREAAAKKAPAPVTAGFGKIQFDGLMQQWLVGADGGGAASTARIRRMELKFAGEVRPNVRWTVMVDPAKSLSVNTTSVNGTTVATGVNQSSNILQDAFITYVAGPHLSVDVGQEKIPISMEGLRSSSQLLTIERSIMNTLPTNSGRMGDIRDTGIQVRGSYPQVEYTVAVMNDTGPRQNDVENNNRKDAMYRLVYRGLRSARIGFGGDAPHGQRRRVEDSSQALRRGPIVQSRRAYVRVRVRAGAGPVGWQLGARRRGELAVCVSADATPPVGRQGRYVGSEPRRAERPGVGLHARCKLVSGREQREDPDQPCTQGYPVLCAVVSGSGAHALHGGFPDGLVSCDAPEPVGQAEASRTDPSREPDNGLAGREIKGQ